MAKNKTTKYKGTKKFDKDSDDNPLLKMDGANGYEMYFANILNDPMCIIFNDYQSFDIFTGNIDVNRLNKDSQIIAYMRYYEYLCVARFKYDYIKPLLDNGDMNGIDVFQMIKHSLRTRLLMNIPSFDIILEPEFIFKTVIKYN